MVPLMTLLAQRLTRGAINKGFLGLSSLLSYLMAPFMAAWWAYALET